ncbi:MAG: LPS assembly lipoprotein LptE [Planctomycetota bacterium]|nr:LPS assembly lipoprotein LptE [Planctomycetota bacterium]
MPRRLQFGLSFALALVALLTGCAGYQIGTRSLYRPDIRTVYVPMFESDSLRRNLGERLTEAVAKEIELKTPYKVVHRPDADSVLSARITSETKRVVAEQVDDIPRNIETDLAVQVNWYDRRGEYLMQDTRFNFTPVAFSAAQSADFTPEGGQSVATAHQEAIQRLAEQIVSQMESRW